MEIKILCNCGVKYKFDVEPVEGRVPFPVKCPNCGLEATDYANMFVRQSLGIGGPPPVPPTAIQPSPVALASSPVIPAAVPGIATPVGEPKLKVRAVHAAPLASPATTAADAPPEAPPIRPFTPTAAAVAPAKPKAPPNFGLGVVGGLLGMIAGVAIWVAIHQAIGAKSKFLLLGVGFFAGLGARLLSRDEGSQQLGFISAAFVLVGVFGTQYWMAYEKMFGDSEFKEAMAELYQEELDEAKKALAAMPHETDDEIRKYLASVEPEEDDDKFAPDELIKLYREEVLPRYKDLVSGKITPENYTKEIDEELDELKKSPGVKMWLIAKGFGMFKLGLLIASMGLAYRMSANA